MFVLIQRGCPLLEVGLSYFSRVRLWFVLLTLRMKKSVVVMAKD
jgi:hypothetical protein